MALVLSAGWWVAIVQLWPAGSRPYIGGSTNNNVLNLALGYNGVDRIVGGGNKVSHGHPSGWSTHAGVLRILSAEMGYEVSWLLPAVAIAIVAAVYLAVRRRLSRLEAAGFVTWTVWFVVCTVVFSYMTGMVHPYYTIALAPAAGALIGLAAVLSRSAAMAMVVAAAGWAIVLLHRAGLGPTWSPWLIGAAAVTAVALLVAALTRWPRLTPFALAISLFASLTGTAMFSVATAATPHTGSIPNAAHTADVWPTVGSRFAKTMMMGASSDNVDPQLATLLSAHPNHSGQQLLRGHRPQPRWRSPPARRSWRSVDGAAIRCPPWRSSSMTYTPARSPITSRADGCAATIAMAGRSPTGYSSITNR